MKCYYLGALYILIVTFVLVDVLDAFQQEQAGIPRQTSFWIPKVEGNVDVDAVLDEPLWRQAVLVNANVEVRPGENITAPVRTEALLAYDETNIYVGFRCFDPEPDKIRAHLTDRDNLGNDDWVLILFDTFNDQRRSYDFMCNPYGIQCDLIEASSGGGGDAWDAIWYSAGRITEFGYVVEMVIPLRSLNFQHTAGEQTWSFDVVRSYPRNVRHHIGAFPRDRNNNCYLCQAPKLIGFEGVVPGRNIEISPTVSAGYAQERDELDDGGFGAMKESGNRQDVGVTASWNVTSNVNLIATINPDFSQVEADAAQMDINTQFPLYYSEKRPFFLEGSDFYNAGGLVHTRTLAEPEWGVKLTGKSGRNTIGMFTVKDRVTPLVFSGSEGADNTTLEQGSQGSILRYKRDLFKSSTVGLLLTDREGHDYFNRVVSVDSDLRFTSKDRLGFQAGLTSTQYPDATASEFDEKFGQFNGQGFECSYNRDTENYFAYGFFREIDPDFRTDIGFITQTGYRYSEIGGEYRWRAEGDHWFNYIGIYASKDNRRDYNNNPLHQVYSGRFQYNGPMQSYFMVYGELGNDYYEGDKYRANYLNFWTEMKPAANTHIGVGARIGDRIDYTNNRPGNGFSIYPEIQQKIGDRLTLELGHSYQQLNVDVGRLFTANVSNGKIKFQFNRRFFCQAILQHVYYQRNVENYIEEEQEDTDPETRSFFTQVLFSYEINPRTVFFLGYSDNYHNPGGKINGAANWENLMQTNRAVFAKIGYAWQL